MEKAENTDKLLKFIAEKFEADELNNESLVQIIELCGSYLNLKTIPDYANENKLSYNGVKNNRKIQILFNVKFVIDNAKVKDDLIVLAGDNLFKLDLKKLIAFFRKNGTTIALFDVKDMELMKKYGEVELDGQKVLVSFREKPQDPKTTLAAICIYLFPKDKLSLIDQYIKEGNNPDQPGRYIQWLYKKQKVYGFVFDEGWYDIGDLQQYKQADDEYKKSK